MESVQYEEFCRLFLSEELDIPIQKIRSGKIPSAIQPGLEEYKNEIDLYWEYEDKLTQNLSIVNAKWRRPEKNSEKYKVKQPDVLLIQQVKQEIAANKAMIITNTDFTSEALKAAKNHRIALHIVSPNFDYATLHAKDKQTMQTQLQEFFNSTTEPYTHDVVYKVFDFGIDSTVQTPVPGKTVTHTKDIKQAPINRMAQPPSNRRQTTSIQKVTGGQGGSRTGRQGGTVQKGQGPARGGGGGTPNRRR